jgi:D-alanyl-D-alanine carboxypeptidase
MRKILHATFLLLVFESANAQPFNSQLATMLQDTLDTYVSIILNIKGMSASVYLPGQGLWQGTSGVSHSGQPITADMKFGIASNTKLFVSAAMLKLQEAGILSLDDSLHQWLDDYPNINPDITIRQLLNHTSGISDPLFAPPWMDTINANPTRIFAPEEVLSWVGLPLFSPGTSWGYSNINYILAGMIAESATGHHISKIIRDSILQPLGLGDSFYDVEEPESGTIVHRWWNEIDYNDTSRVGLNSAGGCAGALFSTSSEMAQWYHALFSGQVINSSSVEELTQFVSTTSPTYDYGLGLSRETTLGFTYWGHGGSTWGYKSKMIYDTCMGTAVCGLANSFPAGMDGVTFLLYQVVVNHVPGCLGAIEGEISVCQGELSVIYSVAPAANATSYEWTLPDGASGSSNTNTIAVDFSPAAVSGDIVVYAVNDFGAGGNSSLGVTVHPPPQTPEVSLNGMVLHSSAPTGNQWYNSSGIIDGATAQHYEVTATDDYFTIVTSSGCSSDPSNVVHVVFSGVEQHGMTSPEVFPNPVADEAVIEMKDYHVKTDYRLMNAMGQTVTRGTIIERATLQMDHLPAGVYFLHVQTGDSYLLKKIIKE